MEKDCPFCQINTSDSQKSIQRKLPKVKIVFLLPIIALSVLGAYRFRTNFSGQSSSAQANFDEEKPQIGFRAPLFSSQDVFGNEVALSDFQGNKPVLLVFWATWCSFCAQELPDLKSFTQQYQDKIKVVVIASGETKTAVKEYFQEKEINFLMVLDENRKIWDQYSVRGTPNHFLIDRQGKIAGLRPGLALQVDLEVFLTMLPNDNND